jgi:hypothetical protein
MGGVDGDEQSGDYDGSRWKDAVGLRVSFWEEYTMIERRKVQEVESACNNKDSMLSIYLYKVVVC